MSNRFENGFNKPVESSNAPEKVEKATLKGGESDSDLAWDSTPINTFDNLVNRPRKGIDTFDDLVGKGNNNNGIETFDDLRKENQKDEQDSGLEVILPGSMNGKGEVNGFIKKRFKTKEEAENARKSAMENVKNRSEKFSSEMMLKDEMFSSEEELLKAIEAESKAEKVDYFEIAKKIEKLDQREAEMLWIKIGDMARLQGIYGNFKQEGIDIFKAETDWELPYKKSDLSQEMIHERLGSNYGNIGGYYEGGEVFISNDEKIPNATKDSLAFMASGYGLGRKTEATVHETIHGFQDIDPKEIEAYFLKNKELEDKIRIVELESKISGKPPYDLAHLSYQKKKLKEGLEEKMAHLEFDSDEKIIDRKILSEIHAYMFSDPLKYIENIDNLKSFKKEDILDFYLEFPTKKICEDIIGIQRDSEDKEKKYRYDYMSGKKDQAYTAFQQIETLRMLGLNNLEIGQLTSKSKYNREKRYYDTLADKITELKEEKNIAKGDLDEMRSRFRLETMYKSLRVRNLSREILGLNQ